MRRDSRCNEAANALVAAAVADGNRAATGCDLGFVHPNQPLARDPHHFLGKVSVPQPQQFAAPQPRGDQDRERVGRVAFSTAELAAIRP